MKNEISTKNILRLSTPASIYYATIVLIGVIDLLFIGQLGTAAISAVGLSVSICTTLYNFLDGIRISTSVLVAQFLGAKDEHNISQILTIALISSIVLGLITLPIAPYFSNFIFDLLGNHEIRNLGASYLTIRLLSLTPTLITFSIVGFFRGLHNTLLQLIIAAIVCISNVVLDYVLIFGKLGFSPMEVKGAAIATLLAEVLGAIIALFILFMSPLTKKRISLKKMPSFGLYKKHAKISFESGLYAGATALAVSSFAFIFGKLGTQNLAIFQIANQIFLINFLPQTGFLVAASIIVGKLMGAQNYSLIPKAIKKISLICAAVATVFSITTLLFGKHIVGLFCPKDPIVVAGVLTLLWFICADQIVSSVLQSLRGSLAGINDTRFLAITTFISGYLIFLPSAYFFGMTLKLGLVGGYIAVMVWGLSDLTFYLIRLSIQKKRLQQLHLSLNPIENHLQKNSYLPINPIENLAKTKR